MASNDPSNPSLPRGLLGRRGAPAGKGTRLPSIRAPRDLTLGGVPKKTFAPNIPTRRDKQSQEATESKSTEGSSNKHRERNDRGRGRRRGDSKRFQDKNVVQSHSIFEEGPSQKLQAKKGLGYAVESGGRGSGGGGSGTSNSTLIKREKSEDKRILDNLLRDDFVDYGESGGICPVQLPLSELHMKPEAKGKKMDFREVKKEEEEEKSSVSGIEAVRANVTIDTSKYSNSAAELFNSNLDSAQTKLVFLQLPDVLPGDPPLGDEDLPKHRDEEKEAIGKQRCSLSDFREGFIGKVRVRKSGKTELVLGTTCLDVTLGTPAGFLQEVVSLRTQDDSGDLSVLGYLDNKLICVPDFENMLLT